MLGLFSSAAVSQETNKKVLSYLTDLMSCWLLLQGFCVGGFGVFFLSKTNYIDVMRRDWERAQAEILANTTQKELI